MRPQIGAGPAAWRPRGPCARCNAARWQITRPSSRRLPVPSNSWIAVERVQRFRLDLCGNIWPWTRQLIPRSCGDSAIRRSRWPGAPCARPRRCGPRAERLPPRPTIRLRDSAVSVSRTNGISVYTYKHIPSKRRRHAAWLPRPAACSAHVHQHQLRHSCARAQPPIWRASLAVAKSAAMMVIIGSSLVASRVSPICPHISNVASATWRAVAHRCRAGAAARSQPAPATRFSELAVALGIGERILQRPPAADSPPGTRSRWRSR